VAKPVDLVALESKRSKLCGAACAVASQLTTGSEFAQLIWTEHATAFEEVGISKLTLDLHDIFNRGDDIDRALRGVLAEATRIKASSVEIIPGKGSGQLKKRVLRFLEQPDIKPLYHRIEKDSKNYGRLFVHFRWK
jgi:hypothetical protein